MRVYTKRRSIWAKIVMDKYFADWPDWDEEVPIFDIRGLDLRTIDTVGIGYFTRVMPRADVVALREGELMVVEFDTAANPMNVWKLSKYIDSIRAEHVRDDWRKRKISGAFVVPSYEARVEAECERLGYRFIVEPQPVM